MLKFGKILNLRYKNNKIGCKNNNAFNVYATAEKARSKLGFNRTYIYRDC